MFSSKIVCFCSRSVLTLFGYKSTEMMLHFKQKAIIFRSEYRYESPSRVQAERTDDLSIRGLELNSIEL